MNIPARLSSLALGLFALFFAFGASAQPAVTWDAELLHVSSPDDFVLYLDLNPRPTPTAGADGVGNLSSTDGLALPFRADVRLAVSGAGADLMQANGYGAWVAGDASGVQITAEGISVRWDDLPGLPMRPESFRWLSTIGNHFFHVANTQTATSEVQSTWRVTTSLADAITGANGDTTSTRRYITFDQNSIAVTSALPAITRTVTIDGGGITTITGTNAIDGLVFDNAANCVVIGLTLQSFDHAIVSNVGITIGTTASANTITGNGTAIVATAGDLLIRGNSIYANTSDIEIANAQPSPVVHAAVWKNNSLNLEFSVASNPGTATQSFQLDLYRADNGQPKIHSASSPCYPGSSLTHTLWTISANIPSDDGLVLMATSYENADCTNTADGTSEPTAPFTPTNAIVTTTTLQLSHTTVWAGATVTMTANVTSSPQVSGGTITFTANGVPIAGCTNLSGTLAQCLWSSLDGVHSIAASYTTPDYAYADSASAAQDVTASTHVFTGPGNFSDSSKWSSSTLPGHLEHFVINGACTFDSGVLAIDYGSMTLNSGATVSWPNHHSSYLSVKNISGIGGNNINMAAGGFLKLRGTWDTANVTLISGQFANVELAGTSQPLPALSYYGLRITGSVTAMTGAMVLGVFRVESGASFTASQGTVSVRGGIWNAGTLTFANLTILSGGGGPVSTVGNINVAGTMTVNATLSPNVGDVITFNMLTGSGTVRVSEASFGAQYVGAKTLTNLTVEFRGVAPQTIDSLTYNNLTLNNFYGATTGSATVNGILRLMAGVLTPTTHLTVTNSSPSAVVHTGGWVVSPSGQFRRQISTVGTGTYFFPIGTATKYAPMTVDFRNALSAPVSASVFPAAELTTDEFERSGLDASRRVNVIWRLDLNNTPMGTYDVKLHYDASGLIDGNATPLKFKVRRMIPGGHWFDATSEVGETWIRTAARESMQYEHYAVGNQKVGYYELTRASNPIAGKTFSMDVRAKDKVHQDVQDATGTVTMGSTGGAAVAQFDANDDGTFGDNAKALVNGQFFITVRVAAPGPITLTATDGTATGQTLVNISLGTQRGDFNADGKSDLLWHNPTSGNTALWRMNGLTMASADLLPPAAAGMAVAAIGDFDGDRDADVLWRNTNSGEVTLWYMNAGAGGHSISKTWVMGTPSAEWVLQGAGDFDGNGCDDLLWHNKSTGAAVMWFLTIHNTMSSAVVASPSPQWSVHGVGDFDGDLHADILWRNSVTKEAVVWLMDNSFIANSGYVATPSDDWSVKGVGDFSGDGKADIVWRNGNTNDVVVWTMNGTAIASAGYTATPPAEWDIRAVGDFDGNGNADMMWRNTTHGYNVIWLMNGIAISSSGYIDTVPDQNWTVAGPR